MAKTKEEIEDGIKMLSAISEALRFRKDSSYIDTERIMNNLMDFIRVKKSEKTKLLMIAAASKALSIVERNPHLDDRMIIKMVMVDFPSMFEIVEETINIKK